MRSSFKMAIRCVTTRWSLNCPSASPAAVSTLGLAHDCCKRWLDGMWVLDESKRLCCGWSNERPRSEWQVQETPELRIVSDDLWSSVQKRQDRLKGYRPRADGNRSAGERPRRTCFQGSYYARIAARGSLSSPAEERGPGMDARNIGIARRAPTRSQSGTSQSKATSSANITCSISMVCPTLSTARFGSRSRSNRCPKRLKSLMAWIIH
jgi:hypothetical protein